MVTPTPASSTTEPATAASLVSASTVPVTADLITIPEGFTLDDASMTTFLGVMNNPALTAAQRAQELVNLQVSLATKSSEAGSQAWKDKQAAGQAAIAADPVIGGANLEKTIAGIGSLLERFGNEEVRAAFDETGAGNDPHIVRFLSTLVSQLREPAPIIPGNPGGGAGKTLEERLYPTT